MKPVCGDTYYHPPHGGTVKGCGRELAIVPDTDGKSHTLCCVYCDQVNEWPSIRQRGWRAPMPGDA